MVYQFFLDMLRVRCARASPCLQLRENNYSHNYLLL
jgi:hypothetical protein